MIWHCFIHQGQNLHLVFTASLLCKALLNLKKLSLAYTMDVFIIL